MQASFGKLDLVGVLGITFTVRQNGPFKRAAKPKEVNYEGDGNL